MPPPDGPTTAATSPLLTSSEAPSRTRNGPWFFTRFVTVIIDVSLGRRGQSGFELSRQQGERVAHHQVKDGNHDRELQGDGTVVFVLVIKARQLGY